MKKQTTSAKTMPTTATTGHLAIGDIVPAELNVHIKATKNDVAFMGLVESIKANGMIHRLIVRHDPEQEKYVLVDGHRRYAAAVKIGLDTVPVEIRDITSEEAMAITLAANIQRLENDPILEAELIQEMFAKGLSREAISAAVGKSVNYITRRQRLTNLTNAWREFFKRIPSTIDLMERVAAHEQQLQDKVANDMGLEEYELDTETSSRCEWSEFKRAFKTTMQDLDDAIFDTSACENCENNTACHAYLFDFMDSDAGERKFCQFRACFIKKHNEVVDKKLASLKAKGKPAIEVMSRWSIPSQWSATDRPTKTNPQGYVYEDNGLKMLCFSVERTETASGRPVLTPEEKEAQRLEKRKKALLKAARSQARDVLQDTAEEDSIGDIFRTDAGKEALAKVAEARLIRQLKNSWFADDLVDDLMRELIRLGAVDESLSEEEYEAYKKFLFDESEKDAE